MGIPKTANRVNPWVALEAMADKKVKALEIPSIPKNRPPKKVEG